MRDFTNIRPCLESPEDDSPELNILIMTRYSSNKCWTLLWLFMVPGAESWIYFSPAASQISQNYFFCFLFPTLNKVQKFFCKHIISSEDEPFSFKHLQLDSFRSWLFNLVETFLTAWPRVLCHHIWILSFCFQSWLIGFRFSLTFDPGSHIITF